MRGGITALCGALAMAAGCDGRSVESIKGRIAVAEAQAREAQPPELDLDAEPLSEAEADDESAGVKAALQAAQASVVLRGGQQVVMGSGQVRVLWGNARQGQWLQALVLQQLRTQEFARPQTAALAIQRSVLSYLDERWEMWGGRARAGLVPHEEIISMPSVGGRPVRFHVTLGAEETDAGARPTVTVEPLDELTGDATGR